MVQNDNKRQIYIPKQLSKHILSIGPEHKNHRGGVGAVINIYSKYFEDFQFIKSHKPGSRFVKTLIFLQSFFLLFIKLSFNRQIKIVHIHGSTEGSFYRKFIFFLIAKKLFRKKVIYHIHGGRFAVFYLNNTNFAKRLIQILINQADQIICLSKSWEEFFVKNFNPVKIKIIPNIIDLPVTENSFAKEAQLVLLFLGLVCKEKGIFDLLEIIKNKREKYIGKIKLIIGGNGETERLKNFIEVHNLFEIVEFAGWVSDVEKQMLLQKADVYILPSYNEGLPISILEAMSYKHPVISTNVGGVPEIVHSEKNGILVNPGQLNEIEDAIDFFLKNPEKIESYGKVSYEMVISYFPENVMKELTEIYNSFFEKDSVKQLIVS